MFKLAELFVALHLGNTEFNRTLKGVHGALDRAHAAMDKVAHTARRMLMVGGAAAMGAVYAFKQAEAQMAMVATQLTAQTMHHMPKYRVQLKALSMEFGESTTTLAKGMYDLLSASVDPKLAIGALRVAVESAKGGFTDAAIAVDGLTSLLNAYGLSASYAGNVTDMMFSTVRRGKLTFAELSAVIGKTAPMARAAGMSMETMLASIATMTRQGLNAWEATTRLVAILREMPQAGKDIVSFAKAFQGKDLAEIIGGVEGGGRAASGIAALSQDLAGLKQDVELMFNSTGERMRAFGLYQETFAFKWDVAVQSMKRAYTTLGGAIAPLLVETMHKISKLGQAVAQLSREDLADLITALKTVGYVLVGVWMSPKIIWAINGMYWLIAKLGMKISSLVGVSKLAGVGIASGIAIAAVAIVALLAGLSAKVTEMRMKLAALKAEAQAMYDAADTYREGEQEYAAATSLEEQFMAAEKMLAARKQMLTMLKEQQARPEPSASFVGSILGIDSWEAKQYKMTQMNLSQLIDTQLSRIKDLEALRSGLAANRVEPTYGKQTLGNMGLEGLGEEGKTNPSNAFMALADYWRKLATSPGSSKGVKVAEESLTELKGIRKALTGGASGLGVELRP